MPQTKHEAWGRPVRCIVCGGVASLIDEEGNDRCPEHRTEGSMTLLEVLAAEGRIEPRPTSPPE